MGFGLWALIFGLYHLRSERAVPSGAIRYISGCEESCRTLCGALNSLRNLISSKGDRLMTKRFLSLILLLAFGLVVSAQQPTPPKTTLKVGDAAPDFTLPSTAGQKVKLSDFKGKKNVVLAFYVLAFTGG